MERDELRKDSIRVNTLSITNALLRAESQPTIYSAGFYWLDTRFYERYWGLKSFEKPLVSINMSDEDLDDPEKFEGDLEFLNRYELPGLDNHLNVYQSSSPYIFGLEHGVGSFGDHETKSGLAVFRSHFENASDEEIIGVLKDSFPENADPAKNFKKGDVIRKLLVANINTGEITYKAPLLIEKEKRNPEYFLSMPFFGNELLHVGLSGNYFVCIGRPDRIGKYLETKNKFNYENVYELIGR